MCLSICQRFFFVLFFCECQCVCLCMFLCVCVCVCECLCVNVSVCIYVYQYVRVCLCVCVSLSVSIISTAKASELILMRLSQNFLKDICKRCMSQILIFQFFRKSWRSVFKSGTFSPCFTQGTLFSSDFCF